MNIVNKVTLQNMKQNRKKTLVTLIGIILSVALITAISSFAESFLDMLRRGEIAQEGEWHVLFAGYPRNRLEELRTDEMTGGLLLSAPLGCARLEEGNNPDKPYLGVRAYDDRAMEEYPLTLLEGRMPANSSELVLPQHLEINGGIAWKVGDTITLDFGTRHLILEENGGEDAGPLEDGDYYQEYEGVSHEELRDSVSRTYTVVGIVARPDFERGNSASYSAFTYLDEAVLAEKEEVNAAVQLRSVREDLYDWSYRIGEETGADVSYHNSLLSYYLLSARNGVTEMLSGLKFILILIVMIGSAAVIYSSFAISVSERSKYLGMLASVGATRRQKSQSVFYEGFLLGIAGIPLGILVGLLGAVMTMQFINPLMRSAFQAAVGGRAEIQMRLIVSVPALCGAALAAAVTIFLSAWVPARRASRITPVDAVRQVQDVKLTKKQLKVSPITRKLFGFSGELALKNLKRNRKRYRATVLSLILCISLFLSVSAFSIYLSDAYMYGMGYDVELPDVLVSLSADADEAVLAKLDELEGITGRTDYRTVVCNMNYPVDSFTEEAAEYVKKYYMADEESEVREVVLQMYAVDEESLSELAGEAGISFSDLQEDGTHPVLLQNVWKKDDEGRISNETLLTLQKNDVLSGEFYSDYEAKETKELNIRAAGILEEAPLGRALSEAYVVNVYMTEETQAALLSELGRTEGGYWNIYLDAEDPLAVYDTLQQWETENPRVVQNVYSPEAEKRMMNEIVLLMDIFMYSFILLTSLICVTSIFNTISTGMALRRREYAMLESVGMDRKQFHRMIRYESIFYGVKALGYGLPIGLLLTWLIYTWIARSFDQGFYILWKPVVIAVVSVLVIVSLTMRYSMHKIEKANIVDALKEENV